MAHRASILRPALRDYGGQVAQSVKTLNSMLTPLHRAAYRIYQRTKI